ncbi:MAG: hypothetical protein GXO80_11365, partial [Chlorobi bacterium]|nr:hypothetical protein [Chlorobiota bacterium]
MKQRKLQILIILMVGLCFETEDVKAQDLSEAKNSNKLIEYFGYKYPLDDELVNGFIYYFSDKRIKNTPFLNGSAWENAVIYVKGKKYINIPCKYDLIIDRFIIKVEYSELDNKIVSVNKFQIDSVLINNLLFINSDNVESNIKIKNYYEQIYKGDISLYKIYNIRFIDMY